MRDIDHCINRIVLAAFWAVIFGGSFILLYGLAIAEEAFFPHVEAE